MAFTFDNKAQAALGTANPTTLNLLVAAGAKLVVACLFYSGTTDRTGGSPTFNGSAMTKAGATIKATEASVEIWYHLAPAVGGTFTLSVPNANTRSIDVSVSSYIAGGTVSFGTTGSNFTTTGSANPSATISIATGALCVACIGNGATTWNPTGRTGVQLFDRDNGNWGGGTQYLLSSTANPQTMAWTFGTSDDWALLIAGFTEASGSTTPQSVGGYTLSPTGTLSLKTIKNVGGFTEGPVGSLVKQTSRTAGGATVGPVGTLVKQTSKPAGGFTVPLVGTVQMASVIGQEVGGYTLGPTGALSRKTVKGVGSYVLGPTAVLLKTTGKAVGGFTVGPLGTLTRTTKKVVGGFTVSVTGVLLDTFWAVRTVGGYVLGPVGSLVAQLVGPVVGTRLGKWLGIRTSTRIGRGKR